MLVAKSGLSARAYGRTQTNNPPSSGSNTSPGTNQNCVSVNQTQSPRTRPFLDPLVVMPVARTVRSLNPTPTEDPNTAAGEVRAAPFQEPLIDSSHILVVPRTLYNFNQRQFTGRQTNDQARRSKPSGASTTALPRAVLDRPIRPSTDTRSLPATPIRCPR
jgi:hypothetical protein